MHGLREPLLAFVSERGPCALVREGEWSAKNEKKMKRKKDEPEKGNGIKRGV
jgi:hypothetical protein